MVFKFLSLTITNRLQPFDTGIFAWVKENYEHRLLFCVYENIEAVRTSIYNVDVLTEISWTSEKMDNRFSNVIRNSFNHRLKQGAQQIAEGMNKSVTLENIEQDARAYGLQLTRARLENLLNHPVECNVLPEVFIKMLRKEVVPDLNDEKQVQQGLILITVGRMSFALLSSVSNHLL